MAEIRIGCGTTTPYTDTLGRIWAADNSFSGGATFTLANSIANTPDQTIFQSERSAIAKADFFYSISIPNGTYTLKLGFAELGFNAAGQRFFSAFAQGTQILFSYDIVLDTGGANIAVIKSFPITVVDGIASLKFVSSVDNAKISNIEIVPIALAITNPATPLMLLACL